MATKKNTPRKAARDLPSIPKELLERFSSGPMTAETIEDAAVSFKKALIERVLGSELGHHLGYPNGAERPAQTSNQRNGKTYTPPLEIDA